MAATEAADAPKVKIVYKKKKNAGHAHHGGAWKVAFADFMTAMMALFLVLWIMAQSQEVKQAVASYFRHATDYEGKPDATLRGNQGLMDVRNGRLDTPPSMLESSKKGQPGGAEGQTPESIAGGAAQLSAEPGLRPTIVERVEDQPVDEVRTFLNLADSLWDQLGMDPSFQKIKDQILIESIEDGLVIQLLELPQRPLLEAHSERFVPPIRQALAKIAAQLSRYPNKLEIDGHGSGLSEESGDLWLGSSKLANLARLELLAGGLKPVQMSKVAGCADSRPLNAQDPADRMNRRVSILVRPRQWRPERY